MEQKRLFRLTEKLRNVLDAMANSKNKSLVTFANDIELFDNKDYFKKIFISTSGELYKGRLWEDGEYFIKHNYVASDEVLCFYNANNVNDKHILTIRNDYAIYSHFDTTNNEVKSVQFRFPKKKTSSGLKVTSIKVSVESSDERSR